MNRDEMRDFLTPLLPVVFPTAGIQVSLDTHYHYLLVLTWEDGPSIPQVEAVCRPVHRSSLIFARHYTVERLRTVALETMSAYGVSPDGLHILTQSNGAIVVSHLNVMAKMEGPITAHIHRWAAETSFYARPSEGNVLRECYDGFDGLVSVYHPECYAYRLRPLSLSLMSGEPMTTGSGIIQAVPLGEIDPHTSCDLTGCGRLIGAHPNIP